MGRPPEFDRDVAIQRAMELFWNQGYTATSVQDLGAALGLKPGSLYNAFHDKRSLFLAALDCYEQRERAGTCQLFDSKLSGKAAIRAFLAAAVEADMRDPDRRGCLMLNAAAELGSRDPEVQARLEASRALQQDIFQQALAQAQQAGEIDPQASHAVLAAFLVNTLFGLRMSARVIRDRAALLAIVDHAVASLG